MKSKKSLQAAFELLAVFFVSFLVEVYGGSFSSASFWVTFRKLAVAYCILNVCVTVVLGRAVLFVDSMKERGDRGE